MNPIFESAIDDLNEELLKLAVSDFLTEQKLVGEFIVWLEKWKELRHVCVPHASETTETACEAFNWRTK